MGGGAGGTDGWRLDRGDAMILLAVTGLTLLFAVVNALTVGDDLAEAGAVVAAWEPWAWELTSAAFWIAIAIPLIRLLRRLRPPRLDWPRAALAIGLLSLPLCAAHLGWLAVSRGLVYAAMGSRYGYDWGPAGLVYEWRKDLLSLVMFGVIGLLLDRPETPAPAAAPAPPGPFRLAVRDGASMRWFTATEIERIEAAGNYVELHTARGPVLHRATLAVVAHALAPHGFVRIHRSRLVRRDAVLAVTATPAGDFEARLASGATVAGSRRFRGNLV